jgi:hypothetical protein
MARTKTSPGRLQTLERREFALKARQSGRTYVDIGRSLNITPQAAHKLVSRALADGIKRVELEAEELLFLELARLEEMHRKTWIAFEAGSIQAGSLLLRIMDRRIKLLDITPAHENSRSPDLGPDPAPIRSTPAEAAQAATELVEFFRRKAVVLPEFDEQLTPNKEETH